MPPDFRLETYHPNLCRIWSLVKNPYVEGDILSARSYCSVFKEKVLRAEREGEGKRGGMSTAPRRSIQNKLLSCLATKAAPSEFRNNSETLSLRVPSTPCGPRPSQPAAPDQQPVYRGTRERTRLLECKYNSHCNSTLDHV